MQGLSGAAGASGVGGLAQAMANQGQLATQKASASIGLQEQQNQLAAAKGAAKVQYYERAGAAAAQAAQFQGAADARNLEYQKTQGLLAAATGRMNAANQAIENAKNRQMQFWSSMMSFGGSMMGGGTKGKPPLPGGGGNNISNDIGWEDIGYGIGESEFA